MLQFVLGRTKSGKTYEITKRICDDVKSGKKPVLIVTEQFSFESERNILKSLGDKLSKNVSVVSFTRLCDEIEREIGGCCGRTLEDCDKIILINRALKQSAPELILWRKYVNSGSFAASLLNTVTEFKLNAVTPDDIEKAAQNIDNEILKDKLHDISCVYRNYDALISEHFIDPDNRLDKLYTALESSKYFKNRPVYINSFTGFTGQQYKIIERILTDAESLTVALCDDINDPREFSLLYNIRNCKNKLIQLAKKHNIGIGKETFLDGCRYSNTQMQNVESIMFCGKCDFGEQDGFVTVCKADSVYDEAAFAARNIRKTVREQNAKYSDFVVIARDTQTYEEAFFAACKENEVNCFIDRRVPLITMPPACAAIGAVDLALSVTSEKILKFLKSGIGILSPEEIATLENYVFVWNIKGKDWANEWEMSVSGLVRDEDDLNENSQSELQKINALRKKAIMPILKFKKAFGDTPKEKAAAIVELFFDCNAAENFKKTAEYYITRNSVMYDAEAQSWSMVMNSLDSICACFGDASIADKEFYNALKTSFEFASIGITPQMADEVTFGSADRIRPSRPKYAFILGANQGVFPKSVSKGGILNVSERQKLIDNDIGISDNTLSSAVDEEYLVYSNVCCPSDRLFISYSTTIDGNSAEPSAFVKLILQKINCEKVSEPDKLCENNLPETADSAFSEYCKRKSVCEKECNTVKSAVADKTRYIAVDNAKNGFSNTDFKLNGSTAKMLYGNNIKLSPSKIDVFEKCKFQHFCKYGLGAKKLQGADFNVLQRGTIAHFVLQKLIDKYGKTLGNLNDTQIETETSLLCEEYLDGVSGYRNVEDAYSDYLVSTLKVSLFEVVKRMRDEFAQSDFEPVKCELEIGYDGDLKPIVLDADDLLKVTLVGKIDRIDKWNGYVRIIDYKSSKKTLTVPDVLIGKNLQMLLYLYTVCEDSDFGGAPAGVFYQSLARYKADKKNDARLNGLALNDQTVRNAMERDNSGRFLPTVSKSGENPHYIEKEDFGILFSYVEKRLKDTAKTIASGDITAAPIGFAKDNICGYCDYRTVCHRTDLNPEPLPKYKKEEALEIMGKGKSGL